MVKSSVSGNLTTVLCQLDKCYKHDTSHNMCYESGAMHLLASDILQGTLKWLCLSWFLSSNIQILHDNM